MKRLRPRLARWERLWLGSFSAAGGALFLVHLIEKGHP